MWDHIRLQKASKSHKLLNATLIVSRSLCTFVCWCLCPNAGPRVSIRRAAGDKNIKLAIIYYYIVLGLLPYWNAEPLACPHSFTLTTVLHIFVNIFLETYRAGLTLLVYSQVLFCVHCLISFPFCTLSYFIVTCKVIMSANALKCNLSFIAFFVAHWHSPMSPMLQVAHTSTNIISSKSVINTMQHHTVGTVFTTHVTRNKFGCWRRKVLILFSYKLWSIHDCCITVSWFDLEKDKKVVFLLIFYRKTHYRKAYCILNVHPLGYYTDLPNYLAVKLKHI